LYQSIYLGLHFRRKKTTSQASHQKMNSAFVFIKPHAVTEATKALVTSGLAAQGVTVRYFYSLTPLQIHT
jgi:hypothetical protein